MKEKYDEVSLMLLASARSLMKDGFSKAQFKKIASYAWDVMEERLAKLKIEEQCEGWWNW